MQVISFILIAICFWYTSATKALTRAQQLSYHYDKYYKDIKKRWWFSFDHTILYLCSSFLCILFKQPTFYLLWMMCISFLLYRGEKQNNKRQTLQYTPRCIRLMITLYLCLLFTYLFLMNICTRTIFIILTPILYYLPYGMILMALKLIQPFEIMINRYYYDMAKEKLDQHQPIQKIGISGSAGKTSVKNILYHCLKDEYQVCATPYSYNTAMGISKTINEQLHPFHEIFICECGIDHQNEMDDIVHLLEPNTVILTPIHNQHLATLKTRAIILKEKFKLAKALLKDDLLIVYGDDDAMRKECENIQCTIIYYGKNENNDFQYIVNQIDENGTLFTIKHQDKTMTFQTKLYGEHAVMNICAIVAYLYQQEYSYEQLQQKIKTIPFTPHRLEKKVTKDYILLDDAYNANPLGAKFALEVLSKMQGKHLLITSGFVELGQEFISAQEAFGIQAASCCDEIILIGKQQCEPMIKAIQTTQYPMQHLHLCSNMNEALELVKTLVDEQSYVLIENDLPDHYLS